MMLPYTDFFKYLGMVCDKQINLNTVADATLCPCPAGTFRVKDFVRKHNLFNRLHMASQDTRTRYSGWYVCESDLSHSLLTYNKAKRWTVSFRNGCWQCWKGCWGSETPRLHGVSWRAWIGIPTVQLVSRGNAAVQFFDEIQQLHNEIGLPCWHAAEFPKQTIAGQPIFFLPWMVWHNHIFSNKSLVWITKASSLAWLLNL